MVGEDRQGRSLKCSLTYDMMSFLRCSQADLPGALALLPRPLLDLQPQLDVQTAPLAAGHDVVVAFVNDVCTDKVGSCSAGGREPAKSGWINWGPAA